MLNTVCFSSFENPNTLQPQLNTQRLIFQVEQGEQLNAYRQKAEAAYLQHLKEEEALQKHLQQKRRDQKAREARYI